MIEELINQIAEKLSKQRGFRTPYQLIIQPELPIDSKNRERIVIIQAGNIPLIRLSREYIIACVSNGKEVGLPKLRDTLERSLEILPKMQHTLSLVPIRESIALRKDAKNWSKANIPNYNPILDDRFLEISYSVIVKDKLSGTSITKTGKDIIQITKQAKENLSRLVLENEEMEEYRDNQLDYERSKMKEIKPNTVSISIGDNRTETNLEY